MHLYVFFVLNPCHERQWATSIPSLNARPLIFLCFCSNLWLFCLISSNFILVTFSLEMRACSAFEKNKRHRFLSNFLSQEKIRIKTISHQIQKLHLSAALTFKSTNESVCAFACFGILGALITGLLKLLLFIV